MSFCQLAKDPAEFQRKTVRVRGIFSWVLEEEGFEPPECCPERYSGHFYAIISGNPTYPNARSERLAKKLNGMSGMALVVFVGKLNGRTLEVERVEKIEKLSHPKDRDHEPLWVPQNCGLNHAASE